MGLLDNTAPNNPKLEAAREIMRLEAELNRAIRALPKNCYVMATVTEYEIGRTHKLPVVSLTVAREY